jgi:hypothetical protein
MARKTRAPKIENRTSRLKLLVRRKPYYATIAPGISLGYRRNQGAGVWVVRASDGHGANWIKTFAVADDHEESNDSTVLTYWGAQDRARAIARRTEGTSRPANVAEALDAYQENLRARRRHRQCDACPPQHPQHACGQDRRASDRARAARLA